MIMTSHPLRMDAYTMLLAGLAASDETKTPGIKRDRIVPSEQRKAYMCDVVLQTTTP